MGNQSNNLATPWAADDKAAPTPVREDGVVGGYVALDGDRVYRIANSHQMPEFFITLVSSSDHWMFISSRGALTAGRSNANSALFPYYSADKIADMRHCTGPLTIFRVIDTRDNATIWRPFSTDLSSSQSVRQSIYKNEPGNKLWFEEIHDELGLMFRYQWTFGDRLGFIRTCRVDNLNNDAVRLQVLDGLQNLLPCGIDQHFQLRFSNLADAYKKSELDRASRMGIYYLSSIPTDKAEPSEGLRATVVWQTGFEEPEVLLCNRQIREFTKLGKVVSEYDIRAQRGAYLVNHTLELPAHASRTWRQIASLGQDQTGIIDLQQVICQGNLVDDLIEEDVAACQERLLQILSSADARQCGDSLLKTHRHQSNVLFNVMRGGTPAFGYDVDRNDFTQHVRQFNAAVFDRNHQFLEELPPRTGIRRLLQLLSDRNEPDLLRIGLEYLPFTFGRRHGDPTRPWNRFEIRLKDENGRPDLNYQGNWRDIFQNWEALALAWPRFTPHMVFRFVNASTADGYNPYRVTKNGVEWEAPDPDDPWANIGYWGDHQIIYLLKLLERSRSFAPDGLDQWLDSEYCTYSQVPYLIRSYEQICRNPRETIDYDFTLAKQIQARVDGFGQDGKLLQHRDGGIYRATLGEKLLVPALAKMTNFVPEGGIWLNTQRPEWNDANNALAGYGLSMVTVCYLRRYFAFMLDWFSQVRIPQFLVSSDIVNLMSTVRNVLQSSLPEDGKPVDDHRRQWIVDALSRAGCEYRQSLYERGLSSEKRFVRVEECCRLFETCLRHLDHTIQINRRSDGLYHSYNLIQFDDPEQPAACRVEHLFEMLEGQVAVLSSGVLDAEGAADVLDALRASEMYRSDQNSYMLYPDRILPRFHEKNVVSPALMEKSRTVASMLELGDQSIVSRDVRGGLHFNGDFRNAADLNRALDEVAEKPHYAQWLSEERDILNDFFERTFEHRYFTGRSGTFFGYEGLGSIYWHMVSKLVLAAQGCLLKAVATNASLETIDRLRSRYQEIREGTGLTKTPGQYGAFPTDPYSHTPKHAGAQQPGMTGQVKEDILARLKEIGVRIRNGVISFEPVLFDESEFLQSESVFRFFDATMNPTELPLQPGSFAFTICQVPVIYHRGAETRTTVYVKNLEPGTRSGNTLTETESRQIFERDGSILRIEIQFGPDEFRAF